MVVQRMGKSKTMTNQLLSFEVLSSKAIFSNVEGDKYIQLKYTCTPSGRPVKIPSGQMLTTGFLETNAEYQITVVMMCKIDDTEEAGVICADMSGLRVALYADEQQLTTLLNMRACSKQPKGIDLTVANAYESIADKSKSPALYYEMKNDSYNITHWAVVV